jgi:hypothetical protein
MSIALPLIFALGMGIYLYGVRALGPRWEGVDQVAPYVAVIAACQSYVSPAGSLLKALGQISLLFKWAVFVFSLMVVGALGGASFGIEGIMAGLVGANLICTMAVTGLRPGEKLYEELLIGDNPKPTVHPRIMKAHEEFIPWAEFEAKLTALEMALNVNDVGVIRLMMQQLVAGYIPSDDIVDWVYLEQEAEAQALEVAG